jgi:hypothetical protein
MKKIVGILILLLITITFVGCSNATETVIGKVNEKLEYEESTFTVKGTEINDRLLLVENGEEVELTFEEGHKSILVEISMNTADNEVDNTNFYIESESDDEITPYEALPSDVEFEYHEKHKVINFNKSSKGNIEGNLVFSFSEEEIKNNTNTLVVVLDGVEYRVPLNLN